MSLICCIISCHERLIASGSCNVASCRCSCSLQHQYACQPASWATANSKSDIVLSSASLLSQPVLQHNSLVQHQHSLVIELCVRQQEASAACASYALARLTPWHARTDPKKTVHPSSLNTLNI